MDTKISVSGFKEIEAVLKQMPDYIAKRVVDGALRKAAQPVLEEARQTAPVGAESKGRIRTRRSKSGKVSIDNYGKLRLNLRIMKLRDRQTPYASTVVVTVGQAFWGMFQEFGTKKMPNPPHKGWMRRAFDAKASTAINTLRTELVSGIERAAKRLAGPLRKSGLRSK